MNGSNDDLKNQKVVITLYNRSCIIILITVLSIREIEIFLRKKLLFTV